MSVSHAAKAWLSKKGYDPQMGARPLQRIVDEEIKKPLSHEILFGKLEKGGEVFVDFDEKIKDPLSHEILFGKLEKGGEVFVDFDEKNGIKFTFKA